MNMNDAPDSYGAVSRFNHWFSAALVILLLGIGLYFEDMPRGDEHTYWLRLHVALGALGVAFLAFRVIWRAMSRSPELLPQPLALRRLTRAVHALLLIGITILIVTGPATVWSGGHAVAVFDWFSLPSPIGAMKGLHEVLEDVHAVTSKVVLAAILLHVAAAAKHVVFDRDGTLQRMLGRA
jgi:cytochrome b561